MRASLVYHEPSSIDGLPVWLSAVCYANNSGEHQQAPLPAAPDEAVQCLRFTSVTEFAEAPSSEISG